MHFCVLASVPNGRVRIVNITTVYGSCVKSVGTAEAAIKVCPKIK